MIRYLSRLLPRSLRERLKKIPWVARFRKWASEVRWKGATHDQIYGEGYFRFVERTTGESAPVIAASILELFRPASVIDVGCGTGVLLECLREKGVRVKGLEYARAALEHCRRRQLDVVPFDLESDTAPDLGRADVVVSMEVGHQLRPEAADRYVGMLCGLGDVVLFSSETPGGGDQLPRNEQPHAYWIDKFRGRSFAFLEPLSRQVRDGWRERKVAPWFARNLLIFERQGGESAGGTPSPKDG